MKNLKTVFNRFKKGLKKGCLYLCLLGSLFPVLTGFNHHSEPKNINGFHDQSTEWVESL